MRVSRLPLLLGPALAAASSETPTSDPVPDCTASASAGFFDLRPDIATAQGGGKDGGPTDDYRANGIDYGYNFTMNICGAVVQPVEDVVGVDDGLWGDVSAHYTSGGDVYSIG
jgi:cation-dependent mannose-6-phosphate receptor